jgi:SnoaL-like domain
MSDDARYEDAGAPQALLTGRRAGEDYIRALFRGVPDMHLEKLEEWVSEGGGVIASHFRFTATLTGAIDPPGAPVIAATNGPLEFLGMDRSEIRHGRLARHQIFYDRSACFRRAAAPPSVSRFGSCSISLPAECAGTAETSGAQTAVTLGRAAGSAEPR